MIDLDRALEDQQDLATLCTVPSELNTYDAKYENDFYGFATILKEYAGYPPELPVRAVIPHGVYFDTDVVFEMDAASMYSAVLNYPAFRRSAWEREPARIVVPSASPFLYALAMFQTRFPAPRNPVGTLFFPAHTVGQSRTDSNWNAIADELEALGEQYQPISICIYYADWEKGFHEPFARRGMRIVSAGTGADKEFIYRWLHLLSVHRFASSNDVGGAILYAAKAGASVQLIQELASHYYDPVVEITLGKLYSDQVNDLRHRVEGMFRDKSPEGRVVRDEVVDYLLGAENFKTPTEMRELLEYLAGLPEVEPSQGGATA